MSFIEKKEVMVTQLVCSHPKVKSVNQYGGMSGSNDGTMVSYVSLRMHDESKHDFKDMPNNDGISQAEEFLSLLPIY